MLVFPFLSELGFFLEMGLTCTKLWCVGRKFPLVFRTEFYEIPCMAFILHLDTLRLHGTGVRTIEKQSCLPSLLGQS
jgi:hypothetical protein